MTKPLKTTEILAWKKRTHKADYGIFRSVSVNKNLNANHEIELKSKFLQREFAHTLGTICKSGSLVCKNWNKEHEKIRSADFYNFIFKFCLKDLKWLSKLLTMLRVEKYLGCFCLECYGLFSGWTTLIATVMVIFYLTMRCIFALSFGGEPEFVNSKSRWLNFYFIFIEFPLAIVCIIFVAFPFFIVYITWEFIQGINTVSFKILKTKIKI